MFTKKPQVLSFLYLFRGIICTDQLFQLIYLFDLSIYRRSLHQSAISNNMYVFFTYVYVVEYYAPISYVNKFNYICQNFINQSTQKSKKHFIHQLLQSHSHSHDVTQVPIGFLISHATPHPRDLRLHAPHLSTNMQLRKLVHAVCEVLLHPAGQGWV